MKNIKEILAEVLKLPKEEQVENFISQLSFLGYCSHWGSRKRGEDKLKEIEDYLLKNTTTAEELYVLNSAAESYSNQVKFRSNIKKIVSIAKGMFIDFPNKQQEIDRNETYKMINSLRKTVSGFRGNSKYSPELENGKLAIENRLDEIPENSHEAQVLLKELDRVNKKLNT